MKRGERATGVIALAFAVAIVVVIALAFAVAIACVPTPSRAATTSVEAILREPHIDGTRPQNEVLSPDERWVAYAWNPEGRGVPLDLYVVPATGGNAKALTAFPRDPRPDSLREASARLLVAGTDSLPHKLPRYFADDSTDYTASALAWSPDSRTIAFVARGDLYLAGVSRGDVRRLTVTRSSESEPAWSPDGHWLAFVRDGAVWALEPAGSRQVQLTAAGGDSLQPSSPQWSPDGRRIAYTTRDDRGLDNLLIPSYLGDKVGTSSVKEGFPSMGVRVVDAEWLRAPQDAALLVKDHPFGVVAMRLGPGKHPQVSAVAWSPDGTSLAITEVLPDMKRRPLHVARADSGSVRTVHVEADSAWVEEYDWVIADRPVLEWSPDGRWILFTTEASGWRHLARIPAAGGAVQALTHGEWEVGWAHVLPDGKRALVLDDRARTWERQLELLDLETGALRPLATGPGMSTHPQTGKRAARVLFQHSRFDTPTDLWAIEVATSAKPMQLTRSVPAAFRAVDWVVPEVVSLPGRDGTPLRGLLYKPRGSNPAGPVPAVVFVHGAGILQNVVDGWTFYAPNYMFHTVLAEAGYAVFEVDYRGSLGYGRDFRAGVYMYLGGKDLDDELAGIDYLKTLGWVDPQRIGIYGGSYGGFMALMALFRAPESYACGAALRFVADWANYAKGNPWYCIQRLGTPAAHPEAYYRSSPIHFAAGLADPLLLLHGMRDDNVHFQDAAQLTERLIRLGKPFDLMVYPREAHGFSSPASWIDEYGRIASFFDLHLHPAGAAARAAGATPSATNGDR